MVPTKPTGVCTCMREDWNGYTAARLSSESSSKISVHSTLHEAVSVVGVHSSLRTLY